ncbi:MAG: hypothetical protein WKF75_21485, partial [Singulisphaera sp.]
ETVLRPARLALLVAAASLTGLTTAAVAEPLYRLTDLGPLPGSNWSDAHSINNAGEVIANSPTWRDLSPQGEGIWPLVVRAARYRGGSGTIVTPDPGFTATGFNNHGDVLGWSSSPGTAGGTFIYHRDGTATRVDGVPVGPNTHTGALNDSGQLVWNADAGFEYGRAYVWTGGVSRPIDPPGYQRVQATGLNNSGQVIGTGLVTRPGPGGGEDLHGFLWRHGEVEDLGNLGSQFVVPFAINDAGQVTGESNVLPGGFYDRHAFLYSDGTMHDLGTIGGPFSMGFAINAHGDVVGVSSYKPEPKAETLGVDKHAFLYGRQDDRPERRHLAGGGLDAARSDRD